MELNGDLQGLIERSCALKDTIDGEIKSSFWYCNLCLGHGHCCDIAGTACKEIERLTAIRDSSKDVEAMLIYLQRLRSWQHLERHAVLARLEDSRSVLIENVSQYRGRPLDVVRELNACFGDGKMVSEKIKSRDQMVKRSNDPADITRRRKRSGLGFLVCCCKILLSPWKWHEAVGITMKLVVVSATISSMMSFISCKQQKWGCRKGFVSLMGPTERENGSLVGISKRPLQVSSGRG